MTLENSLLLCGYSII